MLLARRGPAEIPCGRPRASLAVDLHLQASLSDVISEPPRLLQIEDCGMSN